ncbi:MAG TPA: septal ring lytic transglycosylase RlpA family protein [Hyphomicrobiaceae bacterium]|jgi:rare lipoprotein A|nr:septal ring lytic transglycosylase RlpA family protein [Hyphomicrobiaceae bacterium]
MRILRVLPVILGMTTAGLMTAPASAESVYRFTGSTEYKDSISINSYRSKRSNLGAMDVRPAERRAERREGRRSRSARVRDREESRSERRASRRSQRRTRTASLGNGGGSWGGGSHGVASYYWQPQRVASGGWFNPNAMTAAHKTLPFGTRVRVTHAGNGRSVIVRINDRGPYVKGRIIDLSRAAASAIGMTGQGIARVSMEVLGR